MSSVKRHNNSCSTCGKTAGIFICRGCSETFCLRHTNEHREYIEKRMNEIVLIHNQLKQAITGQMTEQFRQSLLQQIEKWEEQSIDKIRQVAKDTREQLLTIVRERTDNLKEKVALLTSQLNRARQDGEFFENEIKEWSEKLTKFQQLLNRQQKIKINQDRNSTPFISKISLYDLSNDAVVEPTNDGAYGINNETLVESEFEEYPNQPEKSEYSSGLHSLRFKIEQYEPNSSILFGIVSKGVFEGTDPFENPTLYGWTGNNMVYRAGNQYSGYHGYKSDIKSDDVLLLTVDCDREMITLTNERTHRTYELEVDTTKCPYPWQPSVRFFVHQD